MDTTTTCRTLGVIDIGSNSGRVMVARVSGAAHLDVLGDARSPLRLVRDVTKGGQLSTETIERTLRIVRGFMAVARCAGAEDTLAVATAAVREASNGHELIERARLELGMSVEIADGEQEARLGFQGASHGLPIEHGIVLDVGGGSLQLTHFRSRRLERWWSLPLGALRLNDRFLSRSDPPTRGEMRSLKQHVYATLEEAGVSSLLADERLVGTGGTVRNLAKVDRRMRGDYPISRLHGYTVDRRRLDDVSNLLAETPSSDRSRVPGLNADRSDSIVGGALLVQAVMDRLLATDLTVAGYGLREGVALRSVTEQAVGVADVQRASVSALGSRFNSCDADRGRRRAALAEQLLASAQPGLAADVCLAASVAAQLLDIGASVDYYRRYAHSARIVADANLDGFAHRTLALIAASVLAVGEREASVKNFAPLLSLADQVLVEQVAAAVGLADALERYGTPPLDPWPVEPLARRAERAFGLSFDLVGAVASAN
jgi:exopolyphosphatase / guanosine-5'-triphosphate,3'-diphosphate pyrophosphatase